MLEIEGKLGTLEADVVEASVGNEADTAAVEVEDIVSLELRIEEATFVDFTADEETEGVTATGEYRQ